MNLSEILETLAVILKIIICLSTLQLNLPNYTDIREFCEENGITGMHTKKSTPGRYTVNTILKKFVTSPTNFASLILAPFRALQWFGCDVTCI